MHNIYRYIYRYRYSLIYLFSHSFKCHDISPQNKELSRIFILYSTSTFINGIFGNGKWYYKFLHCQLFSSLSILGCCRKMAAKHGRESTP